MNKLRMNMVKCDFVLKLSGSSCRPLLTCSSYPFLSFFIVLHFSLHLSH